METGKLSVQQKVAGLVFPRVKAFQAVLLQPGFQLLLYRGIAGAGLQGKDQMVYGLLIWKQGLHGFQGDIGDAEFFRIRVNVAAGSQGINKFRALAGSYYPQPVFFTLGNHLDLFIQAQFVGFEILVVQPDLHFAVLQ